MVRFLLILFMCATLGAAAQTDTTGIDSIAYNFQLSEVKVTARWKNDTDRYHYNQMKFYVKTILPYLNAATVLFKDINTKLAKDDMSRKERRQYLNIKEDEMRTQFEDKVKALNVTQGVLLVKLIARQTEMNIYKILVDVKNPIAAMKWQGWGRLHGLNLDRKYHPDEETDLENIMEELGYPLPPGYTMVQDETKS